MEPGATVIRHLCARSDHVDTGIKHHYPFTGGDGHQRQKRCVQASPRDAAAPQLSRSGRTSGNNSSSSY